MQEVLEEFDRVLLLGSSEQLLSYDTTFQLGDSYVSPLLFHHTLFLEYPSIPAFFLSMNASLQKSTESFFSRAATVYFN